MKGVKSHNMYVLNMDINKVSIFNSLNVSTNYAYLWDLKLGYINKNKMIRMYKKWISITNKLRYFWYMWTMYKKI